MTASKFRVIAPEMVTTCLTANHTLVLGYFGKKLDTPLFMAKVL
ncbi:hypothetical protein [Nostoc sp.]